MAIRDSPETTDHPVSRGQRLELSFWLQAAFGTTSAALFVLTLLWRDWIEITFGVDPDYHNGSFEWLIVAALAIAAATLLGLARSEWRAAHRPAMSQ